MKKYWYMQKWKRKLSYKKYRGFGRPRKSDYYKHYFKLKLTDQIKMTKVQTDKNGNWHYKAIMTAPQFVKYFNPK